jgi:Trk-type K+ transport system membrane component
MDQDIDEDRRRLDRNWDDLLQELRVAQTGVQLLTGLLLTVPFQARFPDLTAQQRTVYLVVVCLAVLAAGLLISPVVLHRVLFRQNARDTLVRAGQRFALAGFAVLGAAVVGVITLIFDVVVGPAGAAVAGGITFVVFLALWGLGPIAVRRASADDEPSV